MFLIVDWCKAKTKGGTSFIIVFK